MIGPFTSLALIMIALGLTNFGHRILLPLKKAVGFWPHGLVIAKILTIVYFGTCLLLIIAGLELFMS